MPDHVLDASALLAFLQKEPGNARVDAVLETSCISAANWSEVVQKSAARGVDIEALKAMLSAAQLSIVDLTSADAEAAAVLWPGTRHLGLSLADRCCLATAQRLRTTVLTADVAWRGLEIGVPIEAIR
jgi:ribonuclease VapC